MEGKNDYQANLLKNRVAKNYRRLKKWARKNCILSYRIYDRDIPEIPLSIDLYEFLPSEALTPQKAAAFAKAECDAEAQNLPEAIGARQKRLFLKVYLYERPYEKAEQEEEEWLKKMVAALSECLNIEEGHIVSKTRAHEKGGSQYKKADVAQNPAACGWTLEGGHLFYVDLSTYLDTGLFLDMRPLRKAVGQKAHGKSVLNLFCYTSSFSVFAAGGGASFVESVDLSNTYLEWSKKNFFQNGFSDPQKYAFTKADVMGFLEKCTKKFDIIILDPPTFSNSKGAAFTLDTNRDWPALVQKSLALLKKDGTLYFSTNSKSLKFSPDALPPGAEAIDITRTTIDPDWEEKRPHKAYKITWA